MRQALFAWIRKKLGVTATTKKTSELERKYAHLSERLNQMSIELARTQIELNRLNHRTAKTLKDLKTPSEPAPSKLEATRKMRRFSANRHPDP